MQTLKTIPAALALLLLAAHFLRGQNTLLVGVCLLLIPLLFVPLPQVRIACRVALAVGSLEWALTAWRLASFRMEVAEPYLRMLLILGGVGAFTLAAAWLLPAVRRRLETTA